MCALPHIVVRVHDRCAKLNLMIPTRLRFGSRRGAQEQTNHHYLLFYVLGGGLSMVTIEDIAQKRAVLDE